MVPPVLVLIMAMDRHTCWHQNRRTAVVKICNFSNKLEFDMPTCLILHLLHNNYPPTCRFLLLSVLLYKCLYIHEVFKIWIWMSFRNNGSQGLMDCIVIHIILAIDWIQTSNDSFGSSSLTSLLVCFVEASDRKNPVSSLFNVINNWPLVLKFGFPVV